MTITIQLQNGPLDTTPKVMDTQYYRDLVAGRMDEVVGTDEHMRDSDMFRPYIDDMAATSDHVFKKQV